MPNANSTVNLQITLVKVLQPTDLFGTKHLG